MTESGAVHLWQFTPGEMRTDGDSPNAAAATTAANCEIVPTVAAQPGDDREAKEGPQSVNAVGPAKRGKRLTGKLRVFRLFFV